MLHAFVVRGLVVLAVVVVVLLTETTGLGGSVGDDRDLGTILGCAIVAVHRAAVALIPGKGQNAVPGALPHVHDVLTEGILSA